VRVVIYTVGIIFTAIIFASIINAFLYLAIRYLVNTIHHPTYCGNRSNRENYFKKVENLFIMNSFLLLCRHLLVDHTMGIFQHFFTWVVEIEKQTDNQKHNTNNKTISPVFHADNLTQENKSVNQKQGEPSL